MGLLQFDVSHLYIAMFVVSYTKAGNFPMVRNFHIVTFFTDRSPSPKMIKTMKILLNNQFKVHVYFGC